MEAAAFQYTFGSLNLSSQQRNGAGSGENGSKGATEENDGGGPGVSREEMKDRGVEREQR